MLKIALLDDDKTALLISKGAIDLENILDDFAETASYIKTTASELMRNPSLLLRERVPEPLGETE